MWNPFVCLLYLVIGAIFVNLTGAVAWRKSFGVFLEIFKKDKSKYTDRVVPHKKAFLSTISATVGIGNLAGVATAIHLGGPGALFWMWISALFGMFFRMSSTYFAIKCRPVNIRSRSFATPMVYLKKYMTGKWRFVPALVAGLIVIHGLVLANLVQSNSVSHALHNRFDIPNVLVAVVLTFFVGIVVFGGMRKIVDHSSAIGPWMMLLYVVAGVLVLLLHPVYTLKTLGEVFYYAFTPYSIVGGVAGYAVFQSMQFGVSRGIFSHMSGLGASTFLQGANEEPPALGAYMAAITPFVDTIIICTITGLVILSGPYWENFTGAYLTLESFEFGLGFLGEIVVLLSLLVFSFTTIVAFAHISERCFKYLGGKNVFNYRIVFITVTFVGPFLKLNFVWGLSDIIIALLIIFHLVPLLTITAANLKNILPDLESPKT